MTKKYNNQLGKYYKSVVDVYGSSYTGVGRYRSNYFRLNILIDLLKKIRPKPTKILDAGCGDARPLIEMLDNGFEPYGFDVCENMLVSGKQLLRRAGHDENRIWKGSIYGKNGKSNEYDMVVCVGVLENLPYHNKIFTQFRRVLKRKGKIIISLDNQLFSLFSKNKHTVNFYKSLFKDIGLRDDMILKVEKDINRWLQVNCVKKTKKTFEDSDIDKSDVIIPRYNPLNVDGELMKFGFKVQKIRFFHYHPLPPRFEVEYPSVFKSLAESLETVEYDWRGGILCNCMVVQASMI